MTTNEADTLKKKLCELDNIVDIKKLAELYTIVDGCNFNELLVIVKLLSKNEIFLLLKILPVNNILPFMVMAYKAENKGKKTSSKMVVPSPAAVILLKEIKDLNIDELLNKKGFI